MIEAADSDLRIEHPAEEADDPTPVDESGKFSTHPDPDQVAHITDEMIGRAWADVCARCHPAARIAGFKGYPATRSLLRSMLKSGQLDPGKKTASGQTFIGLHRELCCTLLGPNLEFRYEQTDLADDDPCVVAAATDSNTEGRHYSTGEAICTAVRERLYYAENFPERVPTFEQLGTKYKKSGRSIRDAHKVYDAYRPLFECIEKDWTSVHEVEEIVDTVEPASWPEAVKILSEEFKTSEGSHYAGDENLPEQRRVGDLSLSDFKHRKIVEQRKTEKKRKQTEEAERRKKERKERSEKLKSLPRPPRTKRKTAGGAVTRTAARTSGVPYALGQSCDQQAAAAKLEVRSSCDQTPLAEKGLPGGSASTREVENTDPPAASFPNVPASDEPADPGQPRAADSQLATEDDLGVFAHGLTALIHLQALLRDYRASARLIEALETTLNAAQESRL